MEKHFLHTLKVLVVCFVLVIGLNFVACGSIYSDRTDSLRSVVETETDPQLKSRLFGQLAKEYININRDSAKYFARKVFELDELGQADLKAMVITYCNMAVLNRTARRLDSARYYDSLAYLKINDKNNPKLSARVHESKGRTFYALGLNDSAFVNYDKARILAEGRHSMGFYSSIVLNSCGPLYNMGRYDEALALCTTLFDSDSVEQIPRRLRGMLYAWTGSLYQVEDQPDLALKYFLNAEEYLVGTIEKSTYAIALHHIGSLYHGKQNIEEAEKYYLKGLAFVEKENMTYLKQNMLPYIAMFYQEQEKYDLTEIYYNKMLEEIKNKRIKDSITMANTYMGLGVLYYEWGRMPEARSNLELSGNIYRTVKREKSMMYIDFRDLYEYVYKVDSATNDFVRGLEHHKLYKAYSDSVSKIKQREKFDELSLAFETEKKDKEIALLKSQADLQVAANEKRNITIYALMAGSALLVVLLAIIYNRYQLKVRSVKTISSQKKEIEKKNNENLLLIREIHHRVKNNLQIMYSLLNLQGSALKNDEAKEAIILSKNRIRSMALIHDHLYQSGSYVMVSANEYFHSLLDNIGASFQSDERGIQLDTDITNAEIKLALAVPLGLIINELITNCFKYAFEHEIKGKLYVYFDYLNSEGSYVLQISDNGRGLPKDFELEKNESFGLQLVDGLIQQLGGELEITKDLGTRFSITINNSDQHYSKVEEKVEA
ncbi:MAG: histidine kinase dimerization/phosphoacceptor domain -containing protein [Bacteroidota bacterium]